MNKWINVKDELPDNDRFVLTLQNNENFKIMYYKFNSWNGPGFEYVTHWMELPELP